MTRVVIDRELNDVYIGRPGRGEEGLFGNPHPKSSICNRCGEFHATAGSTIPCFTAYFLERLSKDSDFLTRVLALKGKALWCPGRCLLKGRCHGEVIAAWVEAHA